MTRKITILILVAFGILLPCYGKKKPKEPPTPTQADIVQGCIAVRSIVFTGPHWPRVPKLAGVIVSTCTTEVTLQFWVHYYQSDGTETASEFISKLVRPGDTPFVSYPDTHEYSSTVGRVTDVYARRL